MKIENAVKKATELGLNVEVKDSTEGGKILFVEIWNNPVYTKFLQYLNRIHKKYQYRASYTWIAVLY